ncbi:M16 family metallopeptidase [Nannocystaceae bacterium ST9]
MSPPRTESSCAASSNGTPVHASAARQSSARGEPSGPAGGEPISLRLDNGVWVLILPTALPGPGYRGVVSVHLWVGAGAAVERASEHGCAHLLEHMAFKPFVDGQGRTRDLAGVVERLGGDVNAFTSHDETVFHATVPADTVDQAIDALIDATLERELVGDADAELLAREREVVIEEIRQYHDDPGSRSLQALMADLHGEHAYGRAVLGSEDEVRTLTPAILRGWHRRQYRGARLLLVVTGPVDVAAVQAQARARLAALPASARAPRRAAPTPPREPKIRVERADVQEAYVRIGWLGGTVLDARGVALDVAAVALGQGESSRFSVGIRRRARLVSDVHASYFGGVIGGTFLISAQADPSLAERAIGNLLAEVEGLARVPLEAEELARARALLESSLIYRRETVQGQAHALGYYATASGRLGAEDDYFRELAALDPERVRATCAEFLRGDRLALTVLLPRDRIDARGARALAERLRERCLADLPAAAGEREPNRRESNRRKSNRRKSRAERDAFGTWHATLASGMRVVARLDASVPVVGGWLVWPGGLRLEGPREGGIASLTGMLLSRGTSRRDGDALAREVEGLAAVLDGFAGHDSLGLQFECLTAHLPTILARTLECAADPIFVESELEEARRITLADLEAELDDPGHVAYRTMLATLYGKHPHGRDLRGTPHSLAAIDRHAIERHYRRHYGLARAVLAVAGDLDLDALLDQLEGLSRAWTDPHEAALVVPSGPPSWPKRPRVHTLEREREQGQIVIGFPGLALGDRRSATLDVLTTVLGGQAGRLFERLREREGLVYQVGASAGEHVDSGHMVFYAAASQDKLDAARAAIEVEIDRIAREPIAAHELAGAKQWLLGQFESGMQRRGRIASRLVFGEAYGLGANYHLRYPERVEKVGAKQVLALAAEIFDRRRQVTCIVRAP